MKRFNHAIRIQVVSFVLLGLNCVCNSTGSAQSYKYVCLPGVTLFKDNLTNIKALRFDSIYPQPGEDTVYISYPTIREILPYCDTAGGSLLGRKILKKSNGDFLFFNRTNDTILIKSGAGIGVSWRFIKLSDTSYAEANVSSIIYDSVTGVHDSVKIIVLNAFNLAHNPISSLLNNVQIRLSKTFGLVALPDFYMLPGTTLPVSYSITGNSYYKYGLQPLTSKQIYDYDDGDEFHFSLNRHSPSAYHGWSYNGHLINKVLNVVTKNDSESVYRIETCEYGISRMFDFPNTNDTTRKHSIDTSTFFFRTLDANAYCRLSDEFTLIQQLCAHRTKWYLINESEVNSKVDYYYFYRNSQNHWVLNNSAYVPVVWKEVYATGLGQIYIYTDSPSGGNSSSQVYYNKSYGSWGTPVAANCSALLDITDDNLSATRDETQLRFSPNPGNSSTVIVTEQTYPDGTLRVYDYLGRLVHQGSISSKPYLIERKGLPSGIYYVKLLDNKTGKTLGGKLIFK
ncbi:MAG: T9SS type A sorting domain-containing protein [Bacteroidetes bacterium]|nr:T9SS type A sorting domain-containing protein [Bacteroidota bacterium]